MTTTQHDSSKSRLRASMTMGPVNRCGQSATATRQRRLPRNGNNKQTMKVSCEYRCATSQLHFNNTNIKSQWIQPTLQKLQVPTTTNQAATSAPGCGCCQDSMFKKKHLADQAFAMSETQAWCRQASVQQTPHQCIAHILLDDQSDDPRDRAKAFGNLPSFMQQTKQQIFTLSSNMTT